MGRPGGEPPPRYSFEDDDQVFKRPFRVDPSRVRYVQCGQCKAKHAHREKRPDWCLTCDIRDRWKQGERLRKIVAYVDLPEFLIEAVIAGG